MTDRPTTEAGLAERLSWAKATIPTLYAAIEAEARSALIDELVAAVEGLWPLGSGIEAQAAFDCRAAVLRLLEGARHGK